MLFLLHVDGIILLVASAIIVLIAQGYHSFSYRIPLFALGLVDLCLGLFLLGLYKISAFPLWIVFRIAADVASAAVAAVYFYNHGLGWKERAPRNKGSFFHIPHFF